MSLKTRIHKIETQINDSVKDKFIDFSDWSDREIAARLFVCLEAIYLVEDSVTISGFKEWFSQLSMEQITKTFSRWNTKLFELFQLAGKNGYRAIGDSGMNFQENLKMIINKFKPVINSIRGVSQDVTPE